MPWPPGSARGSGARLLPDERQEGRWLPEPDSLAGMAEELTKKITYRGGATEPHRLVSLLRAQGVTVEWDPPEERRDAAGAFQDYVVELLATGTVAAISYAVGKFRERARGTVQVVDDDRADDD